MKSGNLKFLEPSGLLHACNGTALLLLFCCYPCIQIIGTYNFRWCWSDITRNGDLRLAQLCAFNYVSVFGYLLGGTELKAWASDNLDGGLFGR